MSEKLQSWEVAYGCTLVKAIEWRDGLEYGYVFEFVDSAGDRVGIVVEANSVSGARAVVAKPGEHHTAYVKRVAALVPAWHSDSPMGPEVE